MGFVINNNLAANNSYRSLNATQTDLSKSLEKLSTGLRINRAGDDAAGLSISEGLKSQVTGSAQAARNAQDGISVIQTAEGALTEVHSILQRVRDLAVQAGNDSNNADARDAIKTESDALGDELTAHRRRPRTSTASSCLDGQRQRPDFPGWSRKHRRWRIRSLWTFPARRSLTLGAAVKATHLRHAQPTLLTSIGAIDTQITAISTERFEIWVQPRTASSTPIKSLNVAGENLQAAQSRIADVDMAQEMVKFTKANILSQAGTAMLAQANQSSQGVLSLLR